MRRTNLVFALLFLALPANAQQQWSNILSPTYGAGACTFLASGTYAGCGVDWTQVGVPGGIPVGTQAGSTIQASTYGNGSSDATGGIQTALNSCGGTSLSEKFVQLSAGTFKLNSNLSIPSYCYLVGAGANQTILNQGSGGGTICATAIGSTLTSYINGAQEVQYTDATYSSGSPGVGFFGQGTTTPQLSDYGFTSYWAFDTAGSLIVPTGTYHYDVTDSGTGDAYCNSTAAFH